MSPTQYAYRAYHSTESATVDLVSTIASHREEGRVTCLISCDLSKAYDSVDRNELFKKLGWYGISTHWLLDYFAGRTQTVEGSTTTEVSYGVVQGSMLGPIMFHFIYFIYLKSHTQVKPIYGGPHSYTPIPPNY